MLCYESDVDTGQPCKQLSFQRRLIYSEGTGNCIKNRCGSLSLSLSLSLSNGHIPGEPGLAGTRMSPFWILLELRLMEVVVKTGPVRRTKLKSKCHHRQTNTQVFLQAVCPSCPPTNISVRAQKENETSATTSSKIFREIINFIAYRPIHRER